VPEGHVQWLVLEPNVQGGTERTFEIGVLDHRRPGGRAPNVVVGLERWKWRRAEVARASCQAASPSKIRFAPGNSAGEEAS
jgi:hypothetical protein